MKEIILVNYVMRVVISCVVNYFKLLYLKYLQFFCPLVNLWNIYILLIFNCCVIGIFPIKNQILRKYGMESLGHQTENLWMRSISWPIINNSISIWGSTLGQIIESESIRLVKTIIKHSNFIKNLFITSTPSFVLFGAINAIFMIT